MCFKTGKLVGSLISLVFFVLLSMSSYIMTFQIVFLMDRNFFSANNTCRVAPVINKEILHSPLFLKLSVLINDLSFHCRLWKRHLWSSIMSGTSLVSLVSDLVELCVEKKLVDLLEMTVFTIIESTTNWHRFLELELNLTVVRRLQPYVSSAHFLPYSYNLLAFIQFLKVVLDIYVMRYTRRITLCTNLYFIIV